MLDPRTDAHAVDDRKAVVATTCHAKDASITGSQDESHRRCLRRAKAAAELPAIIGPKT